MMMQNTEQDLPEFWDFRTCGDVIDVRDGTHETPCYLQQLDGIPLITSKNLSDNKICLKTARHISTDDHLQISRRSKVDVGDILLAMIGTIGNPVIVDIEDEFSIKNIALFKFSNNLVYNRFFYHLLKSPIILRQLDKATRGGTQKFVSLKVLRDLKIPLPPIKEQKRIAAILDAADELRTKRRESIDQLDTLLQSTFLDMFGDPVTNPKGWDVVKVSDLVDDDDRVNYGVVQPGDDFENGRPLIRVGDMISGQLDLTNLKLISPTIDDSYERSKLRGNEILVSCVGSIGNICLVPEIAIGFNIARAITRIPIKEELSREFVGEALRSKAVQNYFLKETRTVSQPTLNVSLIKTAEIILPPVKEQLKYAKVCEHVRSLRSMLLDSQKEQEGLFASLQSRAFRGEL